MNKKILIVSVLILALTVALTACKGKNPEKPEDTAKDKVVDTITVTGQDGGVTKVDVFENADGDKYITNVDGEKVPLTTDKDGFADEIGYLVTSKPSANTEKPSESKTNAPSSTSEPASSDSSEPSSSHSGIIIGNEDETKQDSISIDEILKH